MAQSRPPPVRTYAVATSPPPLSPRTNPEKKHHSRRKSGKDYVVTSEKKSTRPAVLPRRTTPQHTTKVAPANSSSRSHRERDEDGGRDSGESFPQFCMTCEKQFLPANNTFLYCSEACRLHDQAPSHPIRSNSYSSSPPLTPYSGQYSSYHSNTTTYEDGPDIIPRFSPTQSRPRSYFNSDPYPQHSQSYQVTSTYSNSPPQTSYTPSGSSTALDSLRSLAVALPKTSRRDPESPPKSGASSITRTGSGVWDYIPFTSGSKTATPTPNATPGNSYTNGNGYVVSQSYGGGYAGRSKEDFYGAAKSQGAYGNTGGMGMDRPLPPRTGPSGYGHRPKSIDLVTPFSGH